MPRPQDAVAHAKRQPYVAAATVGCTLLAGALASVQWYRANAAPYEYVNPATRPFTKVEIAQMKQDDVARARKLREKWRPWAEAHQDLLRKMYRSKGNEAVLQEFLAAVPGNVVFDAGQVKPADVMQITSNDMGLVKGTAHPPAPEVLRKQMMQSFRWAPFGVKGFKQIKWTTKDGKPLSPSSEDAKENLKAGLYNLNRWRHTFAETGEVALAEASSVRSPNIVLWASGRITSVQNSSGDKYGRLDTAENNPQIEPPYDFLR